MKGRFPALLVPGAKKSNVSLTATVTFIVAGEEGGGEPLSTPGKFAFSASAPSTGKSHFE